MQLNNFRSYQLALKFFRLAEQIDCNRHLRDQLDRASSSIVLNLAEGSAKPTARDRLKFYFTAFGSLRECQAILQILDVSEKSEEYQTASALGAHLYRLVQKTGIVAKEGSKNDWEDGRWLFVGEDQGDDDEILS